MRLSMRKFLETVAEFSTHARDHLLDAGYPDRVIYAKAVKASRRGYTDYGVIADRPWLTDKGRAFLARERGSSD